MQDTSRVKIFDSYNMGPGGAVMDGKGNLDTCKNVLLCASH